MDADSELDRVSRCRADRALHDHDWLTGRDLEQCDFVRRRHAGAEGLRDLVWFKPLECEHRESAASPSRAGGRIDQGGACHVVLPVVARQ